MAQSVPQSLPRRDSLRPWRARRSAVLHSNHAVMRSLELFLPYPLPVDRDDHRALETLPGLRRILSRARPERLGPEGLDALLLQTFGVPRQRDWPVAPFTWLSDGGGTDTRFRLRADPVHLRAERDMVMLVDASHLELSSEVADALVDSLNAHFEQDGLRFAAAAPSRWYLSLPLPPDIATSPLSSAAGRNIDPLLPRGGDALTWHRWFNEIQMLFHSHPVNAAREAAGHPTINSVWFWGGGTLPDTVSGAFAGTWGEDPLLRGLAQAANLPWARAPADAGGWLSQASEGRHVMVLGAPPVAPAGTAQHLEHAWFAPLLQALKERRLSTLVLLARTDDDSLRYELAGGDLWKFWRRAPALAH